MEDAAERAKYRRSRRFRRTRRARPVIFLVVAAIALAVNIWTALHLTEAPPEGDAKIYSRMAINILENGVVSTEEQPDENQQFKPSIIRLPGYPLFLAAIYYVAGNENYAAVRAVQGILHFDAAILGALLAMNWAGGKKRRRRASGVCAFMLAAFCLFTINYSAVLLTEVLTIFLLMAMMLTATYAIKSEGRSLSIFWWSLTGLIAGVVVEVRPDSGLFALGLGLTLVIAAVARNGFKKAIRPALENGAVFTLAFVLVLVPWAVRNERVFGVFQPLAPMHAEMPDEFVPRGYFLWLRTWINDPRYVSPMLWELEIHRIFIDKMPSSAFTNDDERARVAALLDQYNNSDPDHPMTPNQPSADSDNDGETNVTDNSDADQSDNQQNSVDESDQSDEELDLKITQDVDEGFEQIAHERIANEPLKFYIELPAIRATKMWFDTHSDFYPFSGELFPLDELDSETHQNLWLPLFFGIVWLYTILAIGGMIFHWRGGWPISRIWILMVLLVALPRITLFGTVENPEPRYLIELFFLAAVLGGIALSRISTRCGRGQFGVTLNYGRVRAKQS